MLVINREIKSMERELCTIKMGQLLMRVCERIISLMGKVWCIIRILRMIRKRLIMLYLICLRTIGLNLKVPLMKALGTVSGSST